ncbi:MAG: hypothetical protein ABS79_06600 [Planctomycetes bacterium SCN 63-9]|nr:MAG: hypothetical protein ABS79_06600 [Planctomycetes bacterium SCN 63-9]
MFVALAVGLGWGIRGDFGHLVGAMYPGAALAMAFAFVSGQRSLFLWMPVLAGLSALGIGLGGQMSYGILHGYAQSDTLINYSYGFLTLFLQGSAWGTFGGALIGLVLERKPMRTGDWLGYLGSIFIAGWITYYLVVIVIGFDINPPRNNTSIAFFGAAIGQIVWLAWNKKLTGLRGAFFGYIGFGLGMSVGRMLGNIANDFQATGMTINHWNVMETSCGFIAGFIYCFGMVNHTYPKPPEDEGIEFVSFLGMFYTLGLLPLWHRVGRFTTSEKLAEWTASFKSYGYSDPGAMAKNVLMMLDGICVLGFVGVAIWLYIHKKRLQKYAAFPVLWLSGTMLLYQNTHALYFFYPSNWHRVNMHGVFWVFFLLMVVYVIVNRPHPGAPGLAASEEPAVEGPNVPTLDSRVPWIGWILGTVGVFGLVILLSGIINGERTMKAANTRWPLWTWSSGPFPGRQAATEAGTRSGKP